jgi:UDP-N-acetyl-D-mannosaminuronate dehydrogenase
MPQQLNFPSANAHEPLVISVILQDIKIAIIGLGYVVLPLAVEFGNHRSVVGFDINQKRIEQLKAPHV